jgi:hypothetical protein
MEMITALTAVFLSELESEKKGASQQDIDRINATIEGAKWVLELVRKQGRVTPVVYELTKTHIDRGYQTTQQSILFYDIESALDRLDFFANTRTSLNHFTEFSRSPSGSEVTLIGKSSHKEIRLQIKAKAVH